VTNKAMRILGIDYGDKRIGVAISDPLGIIATGIAVVGKGGTFEQDIQELNSLIRQYDGVDEIVVGLPRTLSGAAGIQAAKVNKFIEALKQAFKLSIVAWDERLTTASAERTLIAAGLSREKRKKVIDKSAAAVILQSYLDSRKK
jgi:putative Holliday junction resolvase